LAIVIGIVVVLLIAGIGYYYFSSSPTEPSLNMNTANSFFAQKNTTRAEIIDFCGKNGRECLYYCENVNRSNGFCRVLGLGNFKVVGNQTNSSN